MRSLRYFLLSSGLCAACAALLSWHPEWLQWQRDDGDDLGLTPAAVERITDDLRQHASERWLRRSVGLQESLDHWLARRADLRAAAVRERGAPVVAEYERLSQYRLGRQALTLADDRAASVYDLAVAIEQACIKAFVDCQGLAALTADENLSAIDAVGALQLAPPSRPALPVADLERRIRSTSDGSLQAFRDAVQQGDGVLESIAKHLDLLAEQSLRPETGWKIQQVATEGSTSGPTLMPNELDPDDEGVSNAWRDAVAGRILPGEGSHQEHIFVDKWYVMGPFPNPMRSNLRTAFLPERLVDLDCQVTGKHGAPLRWRYLRSDRVRIEPQEVASQSIYYAWSELWAPEAGKYWVSFGSDDYGKVWLNGELIWESPIGPKSHRSDEDTFEVDFRQGVNELLFRCENFGGTMGWSIVVLNPAGVGI